jgi:hypothetical protein
LIAVGSIPAVGDPACYRGREVSGASTLSATITCATTTFKGIAAVHAKATCSGTGVGDVFADPEVRWSTNYTDTENSFTHPITGETVSLDSDQVGPLAFFRFINLTESSVTKTITCTVRVWTGSAFLTASDTQDIVIDPFTATLGKMRFIDSAAGASANDGHDPHGTNATCTYDHTTGTLTANSGTPFATILATGLATLQAQRTDIIGCKSGTGFTTGHYRILEITSNTVIRIKTGLAAGSVANVVTSTGPKQTWSDLYGFFSSSETEKTAWVKLGSTLTGNSSNNQRPNFSGDSDCAIMSYGDTADNYWTINSDSAGGYTSGNNFVFGTTGARIFIDRAYSERQEMASGSHVSCSGSETAITDVCVWRCHFYGGVTAAQVAITYSNANSQRLAVCGCTFRDGTGTYASPQHSIALFATAGASGYASIANDCLGGGASNVLDHHEYISKIHDAQFRWNNYALADSRNMCINGNCTSTAGNTTDRWLITECDIAGTVNGIDFSSSSNNPTTEGRFEDCIVDSCRIAVGQIGAQGYGLLPNNAQKLTVRDCIFDSNPEDDINLGNTASDPVLRAYRNRSYGTAAASALVGGLNSVQSGSEVLNNDVHRTNADSRVIEFRFNGAELSNITFDKNRYYYPSDSNGDAFRDTAAGTTKSFATWQATGQDASSTVGDPGFVDPANDIFAGGILAAAVGGVILAKDAGSHDFGNTTPSVEQTDTVVLYNIGDVAVAITADTIAVTGNATCTEPGGAITLYPDDSQSLSITRDTSGSGAKSYVVAATHDAAGSPFSATFNFTITGTSWMFVTAGGSTYTFQIG